MLSLIAHIHSAAPGMWLLFPHFINSSCTWPAKSHSIFSALILLYILGAMSSVETDLFLLESPSSRGFQDTTLPEVSSYISVPAGLLFLVLKRWIPQSSILRSLFLQGNFICFNNFNITFIVIIPKGIRFNWQYLLSAHCTLGTGYLTEGCVRFETLQSFSDFVLFSEF